MFSLHAMFGVAHFSYHFGTSNGLVIIIINSHWCQKYLEKPVLYALVV